MSYALRAAVLGGVVLAVVVAPGAAAQSAVKPAKLSVTRIGAPPASVQAGDSFRATARIANASKRRASSGRLTFSLRPESGRKLRVDGFNVKRVKGGVGRTLSLRIDVPANVPAGSYALVGCVRRGSGEGKASCRTAGRITISARQTTVAAAPAATTTTQASATTTQASAPPEPAAVTSDALRQAVTQEGMAAHLRALQGVADSNGGNRASGLQGYGGTTQYLLTTLRAAGYQPTVQTFDFLFFRQLSDSIMTRTSNPTREYVEDEDFILMSYSGSGDTTADVRAVDINLTPPRANSSGCELDDFEGLQPGEIALMQRGTCSFGQKAANAEEAGASGAIIFNQGNTTGADRTGLFAGTLGAPVGIPAVSLSYADGAELANLANSEDGATVRLRTETQNDLRTTANILAETPGGDPTKVILVGSHLDSVPEGPGINDNGSGSAFNLELALQMAKMKAPQHKVRFAFWGAEEEGLLGSTHYVGELSDEAFENIHMNLNFDMLGSPNHAMFVYDGDFSHTAAPASAPNLNEGAAEIEETFNRYFASQGLQPDPSAFDGRSDYKAFQDNGKPAGGLFSGAEVPKSAAQAAKWGGMPDIPFDPNYHEAGDTIENIDFVGLERMADAGAHVVGVYANQELENSGGGASAPARSARAAERRAARSDWLGSRVQQ